MSGIDWLPWSAAAFARAKAERKPVLLSIVTTWSRGCDEMDRTSYADSAVAGLIAERFVPIRVDADRRPDISSRYTLGGWPTTAFLNAHGEILGGGTFVGIDRLPSVLQRVVDAVDGAAGDAAAPGLGHIRGAGQDSGNGGDDVHGQGTVAVDDIEAAVFDTYDAHDGTFGGVPRFPHPAPIHLALAHARADRDSPYAEMATTCLDAMGWGGLYDEVDGGFFRYANESDWTRPQSEKLLDVNASLLVLYLDGFETLNLARYAERAADVLGYVQQTLADVQDGGWAASQQEAPDTTSSPTRARVRSDRRRPSIARCSPPPMPRWSQRRCARRAFSATMACGRSRCDRWSASCFATTGPVAAWRTVSRAIRKCAVWSTIRLPWRLPTSTPYDVTGDIVYEMMAEELARQAVIACRDERGGGFFDRASDAHDVGLLRHPLKPFVVNCEAARMLRRLAAVSGDNEFAGLADETLRAVAAQAAAQGPLAAHYVLAVREAGVK